jgi:hypothetical protein
MAELVIDVTDSGTWLHVEQDGIGILGAHQQPGATVGRPFTITWLGAPNPHRIEKFCKAASAVLTPEFTPSEVATRGRAVVAGRIGNFSGKEWLRAIEQPSVDFVRVELSVLQPSDRRGDGFILWARLAEGSGGRESRDLDDDDDAGLYLSLGNLLSLRTAVVELIAGSQVGAPSPQVVMSSLNVLVEYFGEAGTPAAVAA